MKASVERVGREERLVDRVDPLDRDVDLAVLDRPALLQRPVLQFLGQLGDRDLPLSAAEERLDGPPGLDRVELGVEVAGDIPA